MLVQLTTIMTLGLLLGAADDAVQKELKRLEGTWVLVTMEAAGKKADDQEIARQPKWTVRGKTISFTKGGRDRELGFELNVSTEPKGIDLKDSSNPDKMGLGIYKLDGDTLTIAIAPRERPTSLAATEGTATRLLIFKRAKP